MNSPLDQQRLRRQLLTVQVASIDSFVTWWSVRVGDRSNVTFERQGRQLLVREGDGSVEPVCDLAATEHHWQRRSPGSSAG
jgi:hypothetical protein